MTATTTFIAAARATAKEGILRCSDDPPSGWEDKMEKLCDALEIALGVLADVCRCCCDETGRTIVCATCEAQQKIEKLLGER